MKKKKADLRRMSTYSQIYLVPIRLVFRPGAWSTDYHALASPTQLADRYETTHNLVDQILDTYYIS